MITGCQSKVPIICKTCGWLWEPKVTNHIRGDRCPSCVGNAKWTLERFLRRATEVHGNSYNYSQITEDIIKSCYSEIPIICVECNEIFTPTINNHINHGSGCVNCAGLLRWNYHRLIGALNGIYGDKCNYNLITPNLVINSSSVIPLKCNTCNFIWERTIRTIISKKAGCPKCSGQESWTINRFLVSANEIHNYRYNYDQVVLLPKLTLNSTIIIKCNLCFHIWPTNVRNHIHGKRGCMKCFGNIPWDLNSFLIRSAEIHQDKYDYSQIKQNDVINARSRVNILCKTCNYYWNTTVYSHINKISGCPNCNVSKGEQECIRYFNEIGVYFEREVKIEILPTRRYDFRFYYNNKRYLLEFDGIQHFKLIKFFHNTNEDFVERQLIDILKTQKAIESGYNLIRIDHSQLNNIGYHLNSALNSEANPYYSDISKYQYIINEVNNTSNCRS